MKSIINKNNYEAFLLDLSEGNLTLAEEKALIDFLVEHPELEVDVEGLPVLAADQAKLDPTFKADLLREQFTGLAEKDYLMIAAVEGELAEEKRPRLDEILEANPRAQTAFGYYQKTILPKEHIEFPLKSQLVKKSSKIIPLFARISAAAAAILLLIYFAWSPQMTYSPRTIAFQPKVAEEEEANFAFTIREEGKEDLSSPKESDNSPLELNAEKQPTQFAENSAVKREKEFKAKTDATTKPEQMEPIDSRQLAEIIIERPDLDPRPQQKEAGLVQTRKSTEMGERMTANTTSEDPLSPLEYARVVVKKELLKNRSIAESIKDEVASLTNEKVNFEQAENESEAQFALNIGKLKIRKK